MSVGLSLTSTSSFIHVSAKTRDQNFEDSEKSLESEFGLFPTTTNIGGYLYQWWPMATDPLKYIIPIGTNGNQAIIGDQW